MVNWLRAIRHSVQSNIRPVPDIHYQAVIDTNNRNNSLTVVIELIQGVKPQGLKILEVGCSSGYMGQYLRRQGHRVFGVEPSVSAAAVAAQHLDGVHAGTLDDYCQATVDRRTFDAVTLVDVLEHMADPADALRQCQALLNPNGHLVVSVPNVTHGSIRAMLLSGRWEYQDFGILDRTHLRFFARKNLIDLFNAQAFGIVELRRTTSRSQRVRDDGHPDLAAGLISLADCAATDPDLYTFQFVALLAPQPSMAAATAMNEPWRHRRLSGGEALDTGWRAWRRRLQQRLQVIGWLISGH